MKNAMPLQEEKQAGFFGKLFEAAIKIFAPAEDDYPETGVQPFTGKLDQKNQDFKNIKQRGEFFAPSLSQDTPIRIFPDAI